MTDQCKDCNELQTIKNVNEAHVAMLKLKHEEVDALEETIKGLDRRTREYQEECAKLRDTLKCRHELIEAFRYEVKNLQKVIDSLQEELASIPVRADNEMIEIRNRIIKEKDVEISNIKSMVLNQRETIRQYRQEMQTLQRKVDEQDKTIAKIKREYTIDPNNRWSDKDEDAPEQPHTQSTIKTGREVVDFIHGVMSGEFEQTK